jgi:NTE family protein
MRFCGWVGVSCLMLAMTLVGAERPRIGLALAGGSARGLSHIGVLQWMEEHHIPVDYVAGTSMGGLVGGMYAVGFTSQEMKDFIRDIPWDKLFLSAPEYSTLSYRRREDRNDYPVAFEFGLRHGLRLPQAISSGHQVGLVISRFAAPYGEMKSFDELPTPFRCVAVDLVDGRQVIFYEGSLGIALRSTMSLPAIFSPVREGNHILVDGGALNNLPVDVTQKMGAKVIIAVALGYPEIKPEDLESILGIAGRTLDTMLAANQQYALENADIIVAPDLAGLYSTDFVKSEEIIRRGYDAAERKRRYLETLAVGDEEWKQYLEERRRRKQSMNITPTAAAIQGVTAGEQAELKPMLAPLVNHPAKTNQTETTLDHVVGLGPYESANYRYVQGSGNQPELLVNIQKKLYGPPFLKFFLGLEGNDITDLRFGIGARLTFMNIGSAGSEWRTDLQVGAKTRLATEYYWKLKHSSWFLAPYASSGQSTEPYYQDNAHIADYKSRQTALGGDLGRGGTHGEIRLGYQLEHVNVHVTTGSPVFEGVKGFEQSLRFRWVYDRLDSPLLPRNGVRHQLEVRYLPESLPGILRYGTYQEGMTAAWHRGPYTLNGAAAGGTTLGPEPPIPLFQLGGPYQLSSLNYAQLRGNHYYFFTVNGLRAISQKPDSALRHFHYTLGYEVGQAFMRSPAPSLVHDGILGVMGETPLGILMVGGSYGSEGQGKLFFRLGRMF